MPRERNDPSLPTVDRLRHDIDSGHTGEKVDFPDPAAAPLGTDAEAAGTPPGPREVAMELDANSAVPRRRRGVPGTVIYAVTAGLVGLGIVTAAGLGS